MKRDIYEERKGLFFNGGTYQKKNEALVKKGKRAPPKFLKGQLFEVKGALIKSEKGHFSYLKRGTY